MFGYTRSTAWSTTVNHTKVDMTYVDCFFISFLYGHSKDVVGAVPIPAIVLIDTAVDKFDDDQAGIIPEIIEESKVRLEMYDLVKAFELRGTIYVRLTYDGLRVAKRLDDHVSRLIPLLDSCLLFDDNMVLKKIPSWRSIDYATTES